MHKIRRFVSGRIALLLAITLVCPLFSVSGGKAAISFPDVESRHGWAASSIGVMAEQGVLTGYPDGRFRPDSPVSKAEWTVMVHRLFDKYRPNQYATGSDKINLFSDVPPQHWASRQIADIYTAAFRVGGYGIGRSGELAFRPEQQLTRLQLAQLLHTYFKSQLISRQISDNDVCSIVSEFRDIPVWLYSDTSAYRAAAADGRMNADGLMNADDSSVYPTLFIGTGSSNCTLGDDVVSNVQAKALANLKASGIMTPSDEGYFRPKDLVKRAEAVTILDRIYRYLKANKWITDFSNVDLSAPAGGYPSTSGTGGGSGASGGSNGSGGSSGSGSGRGPSGGKNTEWSDKSIIRPGDFFDAQGTIAKNVLKNGEIEAAVQPYGKKFLTLDMTVKNKVDLYVIVDGNISFIKHEEFPVTLPTKNISYIGLRTQMREKKPNPGLDYNVTLKATLSDEEPESGKRKKS